MIDLLDELEAVLPRVGPTDQAREIVAVMARISRAASVALFVEKAGTLQWLGGDTLPTETATTIRSAWQAQRLRLLSGIAFTEAPAPVRRPLRAWLLWIRRPGDAGLDAVYLAGANLRPFSSCAAPLLRLGALLVRIQEPAASSVAAP